MAVKTLTSMTTTQITEMLGDVRNAVKAIEANYLDRSRSTAQAAAAQAALLSIETATKAA